MSSKWDEKSVTVFLNAYGKHPCLWNPYHKDYYNCAAKNEALQKIINSLNIPGFTVSDYLHQIKIIREKYRKEQMRTIKGLQSQRQYKSPFPWYNIVAGMLAKVISDEEKANSEIILKTPAHLGTPVIKSLSTDSMRKRKNEETPQLDAKLKITPCVDATCNDTDKTIKSVEKVYPCSFKHKVTAGHKKKDDKSNLQLKYVPCSNIKAKENVVIGEPFLNYKPTKDTGLKETGLSTNYPRTPVDLRPNNFLRENKQNYDAPLQCPLCGWEDTKYEKHEIHAKKPLHEQSRVSLRDTIPCSEYSNCLRSESPKKYTEKNAGDFEIENVPTEVPCPSMRYKFHEVQAKLFRHLDSSATKSSEKLNAKNGIDEEIQCNKEYENISNNVCYSQFSRAPPEAQIMELNPKVTSKLERSVIETCTQLRIILSDSGRNLKTNPLISEKHSQSTQAVQRSDATTEAKSCTKETQLCPEYFGVHVKTKNASVNAEQEMQNTVCISNRTTSTSNLKLCVSLQTLDQAEQEITRRSNEKMESKFCTKEFVPRLEFKEVAVNTLERANKEIQSTICVSRANLIRCSSCEKMREVGTSTILPARKVQSTVCVDSKNFKDVEEDKDFVLLTPSGKLVSLVRAKSQEVMKLCIDTDPARSKEKQVRQFDSPCTTDTCSRNLVETTKEDPILMRILQQFLNRMLLSKKERRSQAIESSSSTDSNLQPAHEYKCNVKGNYTIDVTEVVNKIKECAIKILKSNIVDYSENQLIQEPSSKSDIRVTYTQKNDVELSSAEVQTSNADTDDHSITEKSDPKPAFESTTTEDKGEQIAEDDTVLLDKKVQKLSVTDKEVSAYSENRDVGTNRSLSKLSVRDVGIQSSSRLLNNSISSANYGKSARRKISTGTQKRDPILVRVIKCNDKQAIVRSDKTTLTPGTDIKLKKECIDQNVATCGRSNCMSYNNDRRVSASEKTCKKRIENNHYKRSLTYINYECDKDCKNQRFLNQDWTDVTNPNQLFGLNDSKIPLSVKMHKCTRRKDE